MGGGNDQDNKHNQKLQAVLLADSFLTTFQPITLDKTTPKVLCPLNNVTMLDYAIEYLSGVGVEELYIFCVAGGDAIEKHIQKKYHSSYLRGSSSSIKVKCVRDASVTDAGGALRELYNKNLIQSDPFILMSGDVVTNADIGPAMKEHAARHKKDNSAIMTVLLKRAGGWSVNNGNNGDNNDDNNDNQTATHSGASSKVSPLQSLSEDLTVALAHPNPNTNTLKSIPQTHSRVLLYDTNPNSTTTQLPTSFFQTTSSIELYNNMIDTGLYICSPDVLAKFSDEWDYLHIKTFISNSVAEEEEGLQSKIYAKELSSSEYAAKIHDFRTYHSVSKDLLRRWCYPIVPDNLPCGYENFYRYGVERHMMYVEQKGKTKVGKSVTLKGPGMVGSHTKIDDGCIVKSCVIGNDCYIGKHVTLSSCHLWEHVHVEEGATVMESILCNGCIVKKGAVVNKGCIIGSNCIIGENVVLPEFTRITVHCEEDDMFSDSDSDYDTCGSNDDSNSDDSNSDKKKDGDDNVKTDYNVVGKDGYGKVWIPNNDEDYEDDDDEDEDEQYNSVEHMQAQSIGYDPTALLQKRMKRQIEDDVLMDVDHGLDEDDDDDDFTGTNPDMLLSSNMNEDGTTIIGRQAGVDVVKELKAICLDFDFESPIENLRIELNSFKFSQNATFGDCCSGITLAILENLQLTVDIGAAALKAKFKNELKKWSELLEKLCRGQEEEVSVIKAAEAAAIADGVTGEVLSREPSFRLILETLYGEDVVSDEAIITWAKIRRTGNQDSPEGKLFNQKLTQAFLEWIEQEDSSSSGSDDSSSSGSDDSDSD
jgi:translation initiation factor eIF-2B subunit epsilon